MFDAIADVLRAFVCIHYESYDAGPRPGQIFKASLLCCENVSILIIGKSADGDDVAVDAFSALACAST